MTKKNKLLPDPLQSAIDNYFKAAEEHADPLNDPLKDIPFEAQKNYDQINSAIGQKGKASRYMYRIAVAASIAFFICTAIYFYHPSFNRAQSDQEFSWIEKRVPAGKILKLELSDGTVVLLNSESKLTFPKEFGSAKREVKLEGEAYFQVAHEQDRPFIIRTGELHTQVLGTSFNISAYPEYRKVSVTVNTGKVGVYLKNAKGSDHSTFITPNQQVLFNKTSRKMTYNKYVNAKDFSAWSSGRLIFRDKLLNEAVLEITRKYNVRIELNEGLKDFRVNADFNHTSLDKVLAILSKYVLPEGQELM